MNLNNLATEIHTNAVAHGWWPEPGLLGSDERYDAEFPGKIALLHSEVSEALEAFRDHHAPKDAWLEHDGGPISDHLMPGYEEAGYKPEGVPIELADVIIRTLDMCGAYGIDIEKAIRFKMSYNRTRPHKHGGKKL